MKKNTFLIYTFGILLTFSTSVLASTPHLDWTTQPVIANVDSDDDEFERWKDTLSGGNIISIDDQFDRASETWVENQNSYLNDSGTWTSWTGSRSYTLSNEPGYVNSLLEAYDFQAHLIGVTDLATQSMEISDYYGINVTFSVGAKQLLTEDKNKELYELWSVAKNWNFNPPVPYTTLASLVSSGQNFWKDETTGNYAGFASGANLSDGNGDIVIGAGDSQASHTIVGHWTKETTINAHALDYLKFTFTDTNYMDQDDLDDGVDYYIASIYAPQGVDLVYMGAHIPAGTTFVEDDDFLVNEIAYNDIMAAIDAHNFKKFVNGDFVGKTLSFQPDNGDPILTNFYSNMNFETSRGGSLLGVGTWSVENGVIIRDIAISSTVKAVGVTNLSMIPPEYIYTLTGRGLLIESYGSVSVLWHGSDVDVPYKISLDEIRGKKIVDGAETHYFLNNMTYVSTTNGTLEDSGIWKVENGVLIFETTYAGGTNVEMENIAIVFNQDPAIGASLNIEIYVPGEAPENDTSGTISDISLGDTLPSPFNNAMPTYSTSVEELAGKVVEIQYTENAITFHDTLHFYKNMTFKHEMSNSLGETETITGAWSVEGGVAIVDIVFDVSEAEQHVYIFSDTPAATTTYVNFRTMETDPVRITGTVTDISTESAGINPSIIMYLLN